MHGCLVCVGWSLLQSGALFLVESILQAVRLPKDFEIVARLCRAITCLS